MTGIKHRPNVKKQRRNGNALHRTMTPEEGRAHLLAHYGQRHRALDAARQRALHTTNPTVEKFYNAIVESFETAEHVEGA